MKVCKERLDPKRATLFRYPSGESYMDVIQRLEAVIIYRGTRLISLDIVWCACSLILSGPSYAGPTSGC